MRDDGHPTCDINGDQPVSMSNPTVAAEQLLELLLTLKKTTPEAARSILNAQPAIAYALITLMVSMNAVNIEVFQKTLAPYGAAADPATVPPANANPFMTLPPSMPAPIPAIPPHLQAQYRSSTPPTSAAAVLGATPPTHTPPPYGYGLPTNGHPAAAYGGGGGLSAYPPGYTYTNPAASVAPVPTPTPPMLPDALANIPADQKALILRVLTMTSEQINALPPAERATYIQIRQTLGVPTS